MREVRKTSMISIFAAGKTGLEIEPQLHQVLWVRWGA